MADTAYSQLNSNLVPPSVTRKPVPSAESNKSISDSDVHEPSNGITTSKWGIGWTTPFLMALFYVLALVFACGHLGLFLYLNHKQADGPHRVAPQSYVTTVSNILSNAFEMCLKASLAVAFTQYLWHVFRQTPLKVSTIESLYRMRSNPFLVFDMLVLLKGPVLAAIAIFIWSLQIAASFPPGALTIANSIRTWNGSANVPVFNASFYGNGSGYDAERFGLLGFEAGDNTSIYPVQPGGAVPNDLHNPMVTKLATFTLLNNQPNNMPSPCGANCSYMLNLDMPYLDCIDSIEQNAFFPWEGDMNSNNGTSVGLPTFNATWSNYVFNVSTYRSQLYADEWNKSCSGKDQKSGCSFNVKGNNTICAAARAEVALGISYTNNVQQMNITRQNVTKLDVSNLINIVTTNDLTATPKSGIEFPGFMTIGNDDKPTLRFGLEALDWTATRIAWYRDLQILALISGLGKALEGFVSDENPPLNVTSIVPNTNFSVSYGQYLESRPPSKYGDPGGEAFLLAQNGTQFVINSALLNAALTNVALSTFTALGWWTAENTTVMQWEAINVYSFSRPLNLIIPYFLSLVVAIPVLVIGMWALAKNGVAATDGGFMQLIATSRGSKTLDEAAMGGCLGGDESVPAELKELKIRFGELIGKEGMVRRAGFGTEEETMPLMKGKLYGPSSDV